MLDEGASDVPRARDRVQVRMGLTARAIAAALMTPGGGFENEPARMAKDAYDAADAACGHRWREEDLAKVAQAWRADVAYERREYGDE